MKTDVLIIGSGCSGLYCAIQFPDDKQITVITKSDAESSDSFLAQGGICMLKDESDYDSYFEDTMKAGHYENDELSVEIMIRSSEDIIDDLLSYDVQFQREPDGELAFTREGAHSANRILFHKDITGKEITSKLLAHARSRKNITILEHTTMLDILCEDNTCQGAILQMADGSKEAVYADYTILATGGIGGLYRHSTNFRHLTGDAIAVAIKHGIALKDINYIQIHPTTLFSSQNEERCFLISESVRGEGAKLYNKNMERFVNELLPRDKVTQEIKKQMEADHTDFVWEDLRPIPQEELSLHFPNIIEHCRSKAYDVTKECIPVVPAQHYFMGGIKVNYESATSMNRLYAIGETACNGVHGRNRLASNSLLESLVFANRAADDICLNYEPAPYDEGQPAPDLTPYEDVEALAAEYRRLVLDAIEQANQNINTVRKEEEKMFDPITLTLNVDPLILGALREDITNEDVTTNSVMPCAQMGEADLICKQDGVICGMQIFERVFFLLDNHTEVEAYVKDGDKVKKGQLLAKVRGDIRTILCGERTALNYLQRMSGIATYTNTVAALLAGTKIKLLDTRKTTPNNRIFEKYAVRIGGGNNHRLNLSDGVLLKDNHIGAAGSVTKAVTMAKEYAPFVRKIEVETESLDMVKEAIEAGADIIMLDNMNHEQMQEAMDYIAGRAEVEVSGNVTKENIAALTDLGVDYISSGALTYSASIMDVSLKNLHPVDCI